jgi:cob(I)alamin adenosyltransferase
MSDESDENQRHTEAMKALKAEQAKKLAGKREAPGLLLVHTGDGKGKSSAAFGMVARSLGWGHRVGVVQYIKGAWATGEQQFFSRFPDQVRFEVMGEGFTWDTQDRTRDIEKVRAAWDLSVEMMRDPALDFVLLDELNIAIGMDYIGVDEVVAWLKDRPRDKHVCITGRGARPELVAIADLVTEMHPVKHPFDQGVKAQKGVDY